MRTLLSPLSTILLGALVATAALAAADGVPTVMNGPAPAGGIDDLGLVEQWRAGGEDDEIFFGLIADAVADPGGDVYVLDMQLSEVHVYSPAGEHRTILGREGEGPGEFSRGFGLVRLPGGRTGVTVQMPGEVVCFEADGTPAPTLRPGDPGAGGFGALWGAQCRGGHMAWYGQKITPEQGRMTTQDYLIRFDMEGDVGEPLWTREGGLDMQRARFVERDMFNLRGRWALDADGRIYAATERDRYAVSVYGPDDALERVIVREFTPRQRTDEENDAIGRNMVVIVNGERLQMEREVEETDPCVMGVFIGHDGLLWVRNANSDHAGEGIFRRYDVFDRDGRFVRQVDLRLPGDPAEDGLFPLGDGRFLLVRGLTDARQSAMAGIGGGSNDEDDGGAETPLEIICFGLSSQVGMVGGD